MPLFFLTVRYKLKPVKKIIKTIFIFGQIQLAITSITLLKEVETFINGKFIKTLIYCKSV